MARISSQPLKSQELTKASNRLSFVYLEHCTIHRDQNAITATTAEGTVHIPSATLGCLLLGPGTRITYAAMAILGDSGASVVWVGENGVRYYAHGRSQARSSRLLTIQAEKVSNNRSRLAVARKMYSMRFPDEEVSGLTMQQLRGREGARVRKAYRESAKETGVEWNRRQYDPNNFEDSDEVNQALTAANAALYGVEQSVVVALGCSPGLGFIHTGTDRAFVYDIADLYKTDITLPAAFEVASSPSSNIASDVRRSVRDYVVTHRLLERCARDITQILLDDDDDILTLPEWLQDDDLSLWAGVGDRLVPSGSNFEEIT